MGNSLPTQVSLCAMAVTFILLHGCAVGKFEQLSDEVTENYDDYEYVIGPGDQLDIFVWGYEDFSGGVQVRPDGKITTRLVEDIVASGVTPSRLARILEQEYTEFVNNPVVSVTVSGFVGTSGQQIRVFGAGSEPQSVPFSANMTLIDLMIRIGNLGEFAKGNKSVLIRTVENEQKKYRLRLHDLVNDGDISANVALKPGDIIVIPESWF